MFSYKSLCETCDTEATENHNLIKIIKGLRDAIYTQKNN